MNDVRKEGTKKKMKQRTIFPGESMPAPDSDIEGRSKRGYGVATAIHVSRRGARRSRATRGLPQDCSDASGEGTR